MEVDILLNEDKVFLFAGASLKHAYGSIFWASPCGLLGLLMHAGVYKRGRDAGAGCQWVTIQEEQDNPCSFCPLFSTVKEGTFEIGTCPTLHSGSNWSIKCWQSIMHLGRWGRQTCWRHIALCLDKSKAVTSSCCREIVSPEGAIHRIDSNFLIWEHTIEICPKKRFYL